jgi:hypothetical protein
MHPYTEGYIGGLQLLSYTGPCSLEDCYSICLKVEEFVHHILCRHTPPPPPNFHSLHDLLAKMVSSRAFRDLL